MYTLILENEKGKQIELTHNKAYDITSVEGLSPADATINTSESANFDGSRFNSSRVNNRNIVITFVINGPAEKNRLALYEIVKTKRAVRVYFKNSSRDVYIDGRVQSFDVGMFEQKQTGQISILCPEPFFKEKDGTVLDFSAIIADFEFPFSIPEEGIEFSHLELNVEKSIINSGDVPTGVVMLLRAVGAVETPKIFNVDTREYMILNLSMSAGDEIVINTNVGQKSIIMTKSSGNVVNVINYLQNGSTWFQLEPGDNVFTYTADASPENLYLQFDYRNQYEGV